MPYQSSCFRYSKENSSGYQLWVGLDECRGQRYDSKEDDLNRDPYRADPFHDDVGRYIRDCVL
jgi:hypothetical protein